MTLVSDSFLPFARVRCAGLGVPELRFVVVPHPMASRPQAEAEAIALERFDEVIAALTSA